MTVSSATDGVQLVYEAFDPEGDLYSINLSAEYSHGVSTLIYSDNYSAHANPAHNWQGVATDTRPTSPAVWVPPYTCAYLFQISAYSRTTNGYQFPVLWSTDFQTVTLIKPGIIVKSIPLLEQIHITPGGFETLPASATTATTGTTVTNIALAPAKALPLRTR